MAVSVFSPDGWPRRVRLAQSNRRDGVSVPPFQSFNLGAHVGDDDASVGANRRLLAERLPGVDVAWLSQEHGIGVVRAERDVQAPVADASWTRESGLACAVLTADCLPVLLTDRDGQVVAAAHAGWRGLAAGVLEATVRAMAVDPSRLLAWLGPAIGPGTFEVGPEVREAFLQKEAGEMDRAGIDACFAPCASGDRYLADLPGLARRRLAALGISTVVSEQACTYSDADTYFSYRRDGSTGRMASLIFRVDD